MTNSEWLPEDPEMQSVDALAEYLLEEGLSQFTGEMLQHLNFNLRRPVHEIRKELEGWGFTIAPRPKPGRIRGFTTSSHDRWFGPGSCKTHGGSGCEQINGFAGRRG